MLGRAWIGALFALLAAASALAAPARAAPPADEDGYDLWLRYRPIEAAAAAEYRRHVVSLVPAGGSATIRAATSELSRGVKGMLGQEPKVSARPGPGAVVYGTPASSLIIAELALPLSDLGAEGYLIRSVSLSGADLTVIAANSDAGVLYGAFALLQRMETRRTLGGLDIRSAPKLKLRILDHWDNLDRTVERGYAGQSIWDWHTLPGFKRQRYVDYARADASIGINGAVLNNVNAKAISLSPAYIGKAAALADIFRPYGVRVYLSARFSAPIELGGLRTADPLDPAVRAWWKAKADEIYRAIPDFGGFLVKANSEGQPGPQDYRRTHADGANMLADALAPHGGVVMWRAFVYSSEQPDDRTKQAFTEFTPLDGQFRDNVVLQVKNGPLDFQPREPFHPLFGAMPRSQLMPELQITKEYLGFATHLVYLGALYEEALQSDTWRKGRGSTVARVIDGSLYPQRLTGMAGVANVGADRTWSGSHFDQANWYVFGRLAWDPEAHADAIAEDWARMTFSNDPKFVKPVVALMMGSREAAVEYMTPLGLAHLMGTSHHYGPAPWVDDAGRADWNPVYYHRAEAGGVGFDRTASGSNALSQYAPEAAARFAETGGANPYLLWFHHLPWSYRMPSGRSLWGELVTTYGDGVRKVKAMRAEWARLQPYVDARRFSEVSQFLAIQENEAQWWRDASVAYFQSISKLPLPPGEAPPPHDLAWYKALSFPYAPG